MGFLLSVSRRYLVGIASVRPRRCRIGPVAPVSRAKRRAPPHPISAWPTARPQDIVGLDSAPSPKGAAMPLTPEQQAEIDAARAETRQTLRATSDGMERHLYTAHAVLDHGFVR